MPAPVYPHVDARLAISLAILGASRNLVVLATRGHPQLAVCYNPEENRLNVSGGL